MKAKRSLKKSSARPEVMWTHSLGFYLEMSVQDYGTSHPVACVPFENLNNANSLVRFCERSVDDRVDKLARAMFRAAHPEGKWFPGEAFTIHWIDEAEDFLNEIGLVHPQLPR